MKVFAKFYSRSTINNGSNTIFIVLIPKKEETNEFSDYQPIGLVSSLYKIVVKCYL